MNSPDATTAINRSFPELREFLLTEICGLDYPAKHLIEQARNKGHITKGKRGRGGGTVTSLDMAVLLTAILAGDTPQLASDAIATMTASTPQPFFNDEDDWLEGMKSRWWDGSFTQVISGLIDAARMSPMLGIDDLICTIHRAPFLHATVDWQYVLPPTSSDTVYETRHVNYINQDKHRDREFSGRQKIGASFDGFTLRIVANWLEGRGGY